MIKTTDERLAENFEPREVLASRLIDAWYDSHGSQISWKKAVQIAAIIMKISPKEIEKLLEIER